jgi:hypothetical protein
MTQEEHSTFYFYDEKYNEDDPFRRKLKIHVKGVEGCYKVWESGAK